LQCRDWQTNFDSRLNALEEQAKKDTNKVVGIESRFSAMEYCSESLIELCALNHQQGLDLSDKVAKIETKAADPEENLRQHVQEAIHQHKIEQKRHSNNLMAIPEDGNPVMDECIGGICLARKPDHPRQRGSDQKQKLAISEGSIAHRLCVVECNIDHIASILEIVETGLLNMKGQEPANNSAGSICWRSNQKSTNCNTMTNSCEAFESSGVAHQSEAVPVVCRHHSAFSKESACAVEHEDRPALQGITDRLHQEDANAQVEHGHSELQLMLAEARRYLEKAVPLNKCHLNHQCSTIAEESDTASQMRTN